MSLISISLRCAACGGDLRGCDVLGLCAECHRPVSKTIHVEALDQATLAIREDVACAGCGYNLRTLSLEAKCPECARNVVDSLARNELYLADVKWLRRVRSGAVMLFAGLMGAFAVAATSVAAVGAYPAARGLAGYSYSRQRLQYAILFLICEIACLLGIVRIVSKPKTGLCTRWKPLSVAAVFLAFAAIVSDAAPVPFAAWLKWPQPLAGFLYRAIRIALLPAAFICVLICLRRIALLGKRRALMRLTSILTVMCMIAGSLQLYPVVFARYIAVLPMTIASGIWLSFARNAMIAAQLVYLSSFILGIILLDHYRRVLSKAIATVQQRSAA